MDREKEIDKYRLSEKFQVVKHKDVYFCFNSLLGRYGIVDDETFKFLQSFKNRGHNRKEICSIVEQKHIDSLLKEYVKSGFIVKNDEDEQKKIAQKIKRGKLKLKSNQVYFLGFNITDRCNFKCVYCIKKKCDSLWKLKSRHLLDWRKVKIILDQFFEVVSSQQRKTTTIGFSGGEPLLNFKLIKKIVRYTRRNLIPAKRELILLSQQTAF
jgi:sulfatase maturation enzyme AslB (radical SAM superfamily)